MAHNESPWLAHEPTEKGLQTLERIKERFRLATLPPAFRAAAASELGIGDLHANLNRMLADGTVEERSKLLVAVAIASVAGSHPATTFLGDAAALHRDPREIHDAIAVATVCTIFNGYYRFRHQAPEEMRELLEALRSPINANTIAKSTLTRFEVEAICIAVSSHNNCEACVQSHIAKALALGMMADQIDEIIRAAAIAGAVARLLAAVDGGGAG